MSYEKFRYISGIDNMIDRNEYTSYYQSNNPYSHPYTNYRNAQDEFSLIDRNGDGRIDYYEFRDAEQRKYGHGYYPGSYSQFGYGGYRY